MYIKLNKKQLINKVVKLTKEKTDLIEANNLKGETLENLQDKYDDMVKVKESIQLQNQNLEKRLLATEVELLRKIVSLYEKQPVQQPIIYNYPNSNGVPLNGTTTGATTGTTTTTSNTFYGN